MVFDNECCHVQYFYNSIIEFVYFIILYIESYDVITLSTVTKHIKFFKPEVGHFISSFNGNTLEDKLMQMLIRINVFKILGNVVEGNNNTKSHKTYIFDDLVFSKTVDLALRGFTSIQDICKNINFNNVISINEADLLHMLERSSCFCIQNHCVSILHFHGILGFDSNFSEKVINYFQNILHHSQTLTLIEIEHHGKFISSCGINGTLPILCILHCSKIFQFENGMLKLSNNFIENPKKGPINLKEIGDNISSKTLSVGQIVYQVYGFFIQKWTGEICSLNENSGLIYCVIDFADSDQGIFKVYFDKSALKVISEVFNLKECFKIRDAVEFDAEYKKSKKLGYYWRATKVKPLNSDVLKYNESLLTKLNERSEIQRKHCISGCCILKDNSLYSIVFQTLDSEVNDENIKKYKMEMDETKNESFGDNKEIYSESKHKNSSILKNVNNFDIKTHELSKADFEYIPNFLFLDYSFMFGHIIMLMNDKGIAIGKKRDTTFNILFFRESLYPSNEFSNLIIKGTKILAIIPYIEKMDTVAVASFVYGLSDEEREGDMSNPKEFANCVLKRTCIDMQLDRNYNYCSVINSILTFQPGCFVNDLHQFDYLLELLGSIANLCYVPFFNNHLHRICKSLVKKENEALTKKDQISFVLRLAKCFKQNKFHTRNKIKSKQKQKTECLECDHNFNYSQTIISNNNVYDNDLTASRENFRFYEFVEGFPNNLSCVENNCNVLISDQEFEKIQQSMPVESMFSLHDLEIESCKENYNKNRCNERLCSSSNNNNGSATRSNCKNCFNRPVKAIARIVLITQTFVFVCATINDLKVVLPFPMRLFPENAQGRIKLNSCCEIVVVPNSVITLSHILSINLSVNNENK